MAQTSPELLDDMTSSGESWVFDTTVETPIELDVEKKQREAEYATFFAEYGGEARALIQREISDYHSLQDKMLAAPMGSEEQHDLYTKVLFLKSQLKQSICRQFAQRSIYPMKDVNLRKRQPVVIASRAERNAHVEQYFERAVGLLGKFGTTRQVIVPSDLTHTQARESFDDLLHPAPGHITLTRTGNLPTDEIRIAEQFSEIVHHLREASHVVGDRVLQAVDWVTHVSGEIEMDNSKTNERT